MSEAAEAIIIDALREIGAIPPYEEDAQPEDFKRGTRRLQLILDNLVGTEDLWWFQPSSEEIVITTESSYDLSALTDGLEFTNNAFIEINGTDRRQLTLIRKSQYDAWKNSESISGYSEPEFLYVERKEPAIAYLLPAPSASLVGAKLIIEGQNYAPDIIGDKGQVNHGFPRSWHLYLVKELAFQLSGGVITTLPIQERNMKKSEADSMLDKLMTRSGKENVRRVRATAFHDF